MRLCAGQSSSSRILGEKYLVVEEGLNSRTAAITPEDEPYLNGLTYLAPCVRSHQPLDLVILMLEPMI